MGWDKKNFSGRKLGLGTTEISGQTTSDCELPERGRLARLIKLPFMNFKQAVPDE
jgi:hypothetical protein